MSKKKENGLKQAYADRRSKIKSTSQTSLAFPQTPQSGYHRRTGTAYQMVTNANKPTPHSSQATPFEQSGDPIPFISGIPQIKNNLPSHIELLKTTSPSPEPMDAPSPIRNIQLVPEAINTLPSEFSTGRHYVDDDL